jgi:ATP-binding cassette subfamily C protein CydC
MSEPPIKVLLATIRHEFRSVLRLSALCAALVSVAAVLLLGLSGWFLSGAAVAGAAGVVAVQAFNYLLPSAGIRFLAIARTVLRYFERYLGHAGALRALA